MGTEDLIHRRANKIVTLHQENLDKTHQGKHINDRCAEVAELVDALGSGSSVRTDVGVRISPSAPLNFQGFIPVIAG